jgi:hypothetical protein
VPQLALLRGVADELVVYEIAAVRSSRERWWIFYLLVAS